MTEQQIIIAEDFKQRMNQGGLMIKELLAIPIKPENKEIILTKIAEFEAFEAECLVIWEENKEFLSHNGYCKRRSTYNSSKDFYKLRVAKF